MTVFCGPSGSGKSSLAMDTIYAEGQRRYVESLSAYARQFVGQMQKPKVDHIDGLSPAIAIEQKNLGNTPRSTVGTVTEIYDYLRILMARLGQPYCPDCDVPVGTQTADEVIDKIMAEPEGTRLYLMAPVEIEVGGSTSRCGTRSARRATRGSASTARRIRWTSRPRSTAGAASGRGGDRSDRRPGRTRGRGSPTASRMRWRWAAACCTWPTRATPRPSRVGRSRSTASTWPATVAGAVSSRLTPHRFSFNSPLGWCESCQGLGRASRRESGGLVARSGADAGPRGAGPVAHLGPCRVAADAGCAGSRLRSAAGQAVPAIELAPAPHPDARHGRAVVRRLRRQGRPAGVSLPVQGALPGLGRSVADLAVAARAAGTIRGPGRMFGLRRQPAARRRGGRAVPRPDDGRIVPSAAGRILRSGRPWKLTARERKVAGELVREIRGRVQFLLDVGLDYLTLARGAATLSNGEAQRIRLASQLGSGLCGVLYVLDEPTIGLHPRDNKRLLSALHKLRDLGNTLDRGRTRPRSDLRQRPHLRFRAGRRQTGRPDRRRRNIPATGRRAGRHRALPERQEGDRRSGQPPPGVGCNRQGLAAFARIVSGKPPTRVLAPRRLAGGPSVPGITT
jgi:excinuclease ABC subunit A